MNNTQMQLVNFISAAIYDESIEVDSAEKIKWKSIIDEAEAHNVKGLLYSAIRRSRDLKYIEKEDLEQWKKDTFYTGIYQIQHIKQISNVLKIFNEEKISVIVLKGLVIRELYPKPELRTMCDADILVYKEDLNKVKKILLELGYSQTGITKAHIVYEHTNYPPIEVHWTLTYEHFFKGEVMLENEIWENAIKVKVGDCEVLSLSLDDLAVHLCIHMAIHIAIGGFGIRQLCDLVLLVEKEGHLIDWGSFLKKIEACGVEKFTMAIFQTCNLLFDMKIPREFQNINIVDKGLLQPLINDIFSSGVHGNRNLSRMFSNKLAYNSHDNQENNNLGILKRFMAFLFPPINKLSDKYAYAKKYVILTPVAWTHHLLCGVFNREYSFFSKIKFFLSTIFISRRRNKLLQWLDLI